MFLRRLARDPERRAGAHRLFLASGQLSLVFGILLSRAERLDALGLGDIGQGILAGLAGVLIGASIVFNLTALREMRRGSE